MGEKAIKLGPFDKRPDWNVVRDTNMAAMAFVIWKMKNEKRKTKMISIVFVIQQHGRRANHQYGVVITNIARSAAS